MNDWHKAHGAAIKDFLNDLNGQTDQYILKGDTGLMVCYGLDRFSEDIDLDGKSRNIGELVDVFCQKNGMTSRTAKDTETVKRYMLNYGNEGHPLKIEVSYRRKQIGEDETHKKNGVQVYKIEPLAIMKANAYTSRDRIRDLYDLSFISNKYLDQLSPAAVAAVRTAIEYKGLEQFDYIVRTQKDDLIDEGKLATSFLEMYDRLGLLADKKDREIVGEISQTRIKEKLVAAESKAKKISANCSHSAKKEPER